MPLIARRGFLAALAAGILPRAASARAPRAVALSLGVSRYDQGGDLASARNDSTLIAGLFRSLGINTLHITDPSHDQVLQALAQLRERAAAAELVLIYAAGHGLLAGGQTHLVPRDGGTGSPGAIPEALLLQAVSDQPRQKLLFLDVCRGPAWPHGDTAGCMPLPAPHLAGVQICYAAQPGAPAYDGTGGYSPFALALARALSQPGLSSEHLSRQVRLDVVRRTGGVQIPWDRSSLLTDVVVHPL